MDMSVLKGPLRGDVLSPRHRLTFQEARGREPVLEAHTNLESVLAVLETASEARYPEREELTRALIREQRRGESSLWSSALVLAYAPMLCRLRARLRGDSLSRAELDQLVFAAFFEAIAGFPPDRWTTRVALYLRQQTQRAVFRHIQIEQTHAVQLGAPLLDVSEEDEHEPFVSSPGDRGFDPEEQADLAALILDVGAQVVEPERLESIVATFVRGEALHAYVARTHPGLDPTGHTAAYQRIKRQRHRTLTQVGPILRRALSLRIELHALHRQGALH